MQLNIFDYSPPVLTPARESGVPTLPPCPICAGKIWINSVILSCENRDHYGILFNGDATRDESGFIQEPVPCVGFFDKKNKKPGQVAPSRSAEIEATPALIDTLNPALIKRGHSFVSGGTKSLEQIRRELGYV